MGPPPLSPCGLRHNGRHVQCLYQAKWSHLVIMSICCTLHLTHPLLQWRCRFEISINFPSIPLNRVLLHSSRGLKLEFSSSQLGNEPSLMGSTFPKKLVLRQQLSPFTQIMLKQHVGQKQSCQLKARVGFCQRL